MTTEKNKKKSLRSLATTCFFVLILASSFLFGKNSLAVPNNYTKNATSTLVAAEWNNLISDFVNTFGTTSMIGPLGIGTTNPRAKMEVFSSIGISTLLNGDSIYLRNDYTGGGWARALLGFEDTSGNDYFQFGGYGSGQSFNYAFIGPTFSTAWQVWKNGNVGIGTTDPNDIFSIGNSGSAPAGSPNTGHNYTSTYLTADDYALTNYGLVKTLIASATSSISNLWGGVASGHIWNLNTGNTGIGTTTPLYKLEVTGTFKVSTSSSSIILDSGGNVLIGI